MLDKIIKQVSNDLVHREKARDEAYGRARRTRVICKQSILLLHRGEISKAQSYLEGAKTLLKELEEYVSAYPEIAFYEAIIAAKQEFSEASILLRINTGEGYPSPVELGVSSTDYLLGLADVPGELRRQTLDLLRTGDLESAEKNFTIMEEIYQNLALFEEVSLFLKGIRRKLDIIRNVNERTRAELTTEFSRERLRRKLTEITDKLQ
jgi:translin